MILETESITTSAATLPSHEKELPKPTKDYYSLLSLAKNASPKDVREAYFRHKNTYSDRNQALYSLISPEEIIHTLKNIDEAFDVLSNPRRRSEYDTLLIKNNLAKAEDFWHEDIYNEGDREARPSTYSATEQQSHFLEEMETSEEEKALMQTLHSSRSLNRPTAQQALSGEAREKIEELMTRSDEDKRSDGAFFKKLRESVNVTLDEIQEHTKIAVSYLKAIEENKFEALPQPVYVKGFLKSYLRYIGVKQIDPLVNAYTARFQTWLDQKS